jgi:hypothetical protein
VIHVKMEKPRPPRLEIVKTTCDFCDLEIPDDSGQISRSEITIKRVRGDYWPTGDQDIGIEEVDCCDDCWSGRVRPMLKELLAPGGKFRERDCIDDYYGGAVRLPDE